MRAVVQIRKRFEAISKVNKIANAMQIVAIARIGKIRKMEKMARDYETALGDIASNISGKIAELGLLPAPAKPVSGKTLVVVVSSEKGFCGNFNTLLFDRLTRRYRPETTDLLVLGRKGVDFFRRRSFSVVREFPKVTDQPTWEKVKAIYQETESLFLTGYAEVLIAYNKFNSVISQEPVFVRYLPFERKIADKKTDRYIFEPATPELLAAAETDYRAAQLFRFLVENLLGEMGARMIAMRGATDNSKELMDELIIKLNKARQASITAELSEIAGTIGAMQGGEE
ncbi:MAG: ATP synthase F1 subunit gamma [Candidatus Margulisbacteria bacterium]|nr:ATP synthase F1 subunit gamma [Candidatus Margulisiibacteriota bacterium]MBU1617188.1 ATP synthase F1 subunit gamma [Candidatus Margulisiibacteriota bacterium]MBU1867436.1 ATP synthase F1 subunit gamma [Candidatus Margulisiibacteriota bacterium]